MLRRVSSKVVVFVLASTSQASRRGHNAGRKAQYSFSIGEEPTKRGSGHKKRDSSRVQRLLSNEAHSHRREDHFSSASRSAANGGCFTDGHLSAEAVPPPNGEAPVQLDASKLHTRGQYLCNSGGTHLQ